MAAKTYRSFRYKAKTTWSSGRRGTLSAGAKPDITVGSPPEFKGEATNWSPEEMLVGSVNTWGALSDQRMIAETVRLMHAIPGVQGVESRIGHIAFVRELD